MARATEVLARLGLGERLRQRVSRLSAGEAQLVALDGPWRAPRTVIVDEPTSRLDERAAADVAALLAAFAAQEGRPSSVPSTTSVSSPTPTPSSRSVELARLGQRLPRHANRRVSRWYSRVDGAVQDHLTDLVDGQPVAASGADADRQLRRRACT